MMIFSMQAILAGHGFATSCFVGHSYGTLCISRFCQLYPENVDSIVSPSSRSRLVLFLLATDM